MVMPVSANPPPEGYYAVNNQFLVKGLKGFMEFKTLENAEMYLRIDLPGVPKDGVRAIFDRSEKAIRIFATAPKEHKHDSSHRNHDGTILRPKLSVFGMNSGIVCKCWDYSRLTSFMSDGVLRVVLSRPQTVTQCPSCFSFLSGQNGDDPALNGPHVMSGHGTYPHNQASLPDRILIPHPGISVGSQMAYESKQLQNGGLYVRVDMPGVPKENFTVSVTNGRVHVTGEAPALGHDSDGRSYSGDVAVFSSPAANIPVRRIKTIAKNGVIRLLIPPV